MFQVERSPKRRRRTSSSSTSTSTAPKTIASIACRSTLGGGGGPSSSTTTTTNDETTVDNNDDIRASSCSSVNILSGVNACLSGLSTEEKDRYHQLVVDLGGTYTRHLQVDENTHLIAREAKGEKYEAAAARSSSFRSTRNSSNRNHKNHCICIVQPSWLEECLRQGRRVDERAHQLLTLEDDSSNTNDKSAQAKEQLQLSTKKTTTTPSTQQQSSSHLQQPVDSLSACLKDLLVQGSHDDDNDNNSCSLLFSACHIYIAGLSNRESSNHDNDNKNDNNNKEVLLRDLLGKLIRRGLGTIYWDFHKGITHVIVQDGSDKSIRDAARALSIQRPFDAPEFVSPWWVVRSWSARKLLAASEYAPIYYSQTVLEEHHHHHPQDEAVQNNSKKAWVREKTFCTAKKTSSSLLLLKGCLFAVLRIAPPSWAVEFSTKELEKTIRTNGGKILSLKIVEALKIDQAGNNRNSKNNDMNGDNNKRSCYLVGWGGEITPQNLEIHPILSQVKRHALCHLVQVTPIWLYTCLTEQRVLKPSCNPTLFVPSKRPIHSFSSSSLLVQQQQQQQQSPIDNQTLKKKKKKVDSNTTSCASSTTNTSSSSSTLRISVTGFTNYQRTALIHTIRAMGAIYDDSMSSTDTTHLICCTNTGPKYETALKFPNKIKIVSIEWLYHVMQYGFHGGGENNNKKKGRQQQAGNSGGGNTSGCETMFPFK